MKSFSDSDLFFASSTAERLYCEHAANLPIIELYRHLDASAIAENRPISNVTELLLYGDRDKAELMRVCGVDERFITGNASDFEKFRELCRIMPMLIGNKQYVICHTELRRYFNCDLTIDLNNCETIWRETSEALSAHRLGAYDYLKNSGIKAIFIASSPIDDLTPYNTVKLHGEEPSILPVFCPSRCFEIGKKGNSEYFSEIENRTSVSICDYNSLCQAYSALMDRFGEVGCKTAYHNIGAAYSFTRPDPHHADLILKKALVGTRITKEELSLWQTQLLRFFASEYTKRNWIMQLDCSQSQGAELQSALTYLSSQNLLPRVLIQSGNSTSTEICRSLCRTDQGKAVAIAEAVGLSDDLEKLASRTALGSVIGMRSDIYGGGVKIAHALFRAKVCNTVASWVDRGLCPEAVAAEIIKKICYENAASYFEIN